MSEDSPLGKTVLYIAKQFVKFLEELSIRKVEGKELERLIQNRVESRRDAGDCSKNLQGKLGNIID